MESIEYLIKVGLGMGLFYAIYYGFLKNQTHHTFNRYFLIGSLLLPCLLAFPIIPETTVTFVLPVFTVGSGTSAETAIVQAPQQWPVLNLLWAVASLLILRLVFRYSRLWHEIRRLPQVQVQGVNVRLAPPNTPTFSFFNQLVWQDSTEFDAVQQAQILRHELAHIKQGHAYDLLLTELAKALFWFLPFTYFIANSLRDQHEFLADKAVLCSYPRQTYLQLVVGHAIPGFTSKYTHAFFTSQTLKRIQMMKQTPSPRFSLWKPLMLAPLALCLMLAISCGDSERSEGQQADPLSIDAEPIPVTGDVNQIFEVVEKPATPVGGYEALYAFMSENLKYPEEAKAAGLEGRVYAQFVVEKNGSLSDIKIVRGIGMGCDEEVLRIMTQLNSESNSPLFNPGYQRDKAIRQRIVLPVVFKLNE